MAKDYQHQRGVRGLGLTTSILDAVKYSNGIMVTHTKSYADELKRHNPNVEIKTYNENMFKGTKPRAVFLDNHLEFIMIQALLNRIHELEQEVKKNETKRNPK